MCVIHHMLYVHQDSFITCFFQSVVHSSILVHTYLDYIHISSIDPKCPKQYLILDHTLCEIVLPLVSLTHVWSLFANTDVWKRPDLLWSVPPFEFPCGTF